MRRFVYTASLRSTQVRAHSSCTHPRLSSRVAGRTQQEGAGGGDIGGHLDIQGVKLFGFTLPDKTVTWRTVDIAAGCLGFFAAASVFLLFRFRRRIRYLQSDVLQWQQQYSDASVKLDASQKQAANEKVSHAKALSSAQDALAVLRDEKSKTDAMLSQVKQDLTTSAARERDCFNRGQSTELAADAAARKSAETIKHLTSHADALSATVAKLDGDLQRCREDTATLEQQLAQATARTITNSSNEEKQFTSGDATQQ